MQHVVDDDRAHGVELEVALAPAEATIESSPITWRQTITIASCWVGLTLPGMIEEPGSFAGSFSSLSPPRGPEASQRMSLAIFISAHRHAAKPGAGGDHRVQAPWAANLFGAVLNGRPVSSASFAGDIRSEPGGAFKPVPTAVPPIASRTDPEGRLEPVAAPARAGCLARPLLADGERHGVLEVGAADLDDVMPLTALAAMASWRLCAAGTGDSVNSCTVAMCMAVGNVSLEDWPMLTWSLGCTGVLLPSSPPSSWIARLEMTSLTFMFDWVPEPVCHT